MVAMSSHLIIGFLIVVAIVYRWPWSLIGGGLKGSGRPTFAHFSSSTRYISK